MMNKRGFTLMELLVYMAIVGIVVVIAGQVYSDSTRMRVRTQGMLKASEIAENVGTLAKDDIGQMGAKSSKEVRSITSDSFYVASEVYMDKTNDDYSSFFFKLNLNNGKRLDSLYFLRARYDSLGRYAGVEEISWFVKDGTLYRSCKAKVVKGTADESCPSTTLTVALAEGVKTFEITPATPGVLDAESGKILYPSASNKTQIRFVSRYDGSTYMRTNISPDEGAGSILLSGFTSNYDYDNDEMASTKKVNEVYAAEKGGTAGTWSNLCTRMTFIPETNYEIQFSVARSSDNDRSQMFVPGKDHFSVGFRTTSGEKTIIPDFMFYPPMANEANTMVRTMRFVVPEVVQNVCLVFDIAAYSPALNSGTLNISDLIVQKSDDVINYFNEGYQPLTADKKNVKAFRLKVIVEKSGESGVATVVIPAPSNGAGSN